MHDEWRKCQCGAFHPWGVVAMSKDHVRLYGPRPIETCDDFRPQTSGLLPDIPEGTVPDTRELWQQTGDLDAQATLATRIVVARLRDVGKGLGKYQAMSAQWPEFMGFVISQITDMRGALVRDESKFAHLVAHTDEIVEAMRGVVQLSERLATQSQMLRDVLERVESIERRFEPETPDQQPEFEGLLRESAAATKPDEPVETVSNPILDGDEPREKKGFA